MRVPDQTSTPTSRLLVGSQLFAASALLPLCTSVPNSSPVNCANDPVLLQLTFNLCRASPLQTKHASVKLLSIHQFLSQWFLP